MTKHCKKCDKDYSDSHKFCNDCGGKLVEKEIPQKETKEPPKKLKFTKPHIIILVICGLMVLGLLGAVVYNYYTSTYSNTEYDDGGYIPQEQTKNCRDVQVPYQDTETYSEQEAYTKTEYYTERVPYTDKECESKELTYSITDFVSSGSCVQQEERCIKYILGLCTQKETYCITKYVDVSLNLRNLDTERGNWGIRFNQFLDGQASNSIDTSTFLYPQTSESVSRRFTISGETDCKKRNTYSYSVTSTPKKQVCRDVIKYKDEQRTRQVTAYRPVDKTRPVTNYRTEQRCD